MNSAHWKTKSHQWVSWEFASDLSPLCVWSRNGCAGHGVRLARHGPPCAWMTQPPLEMHHVATHPQVQHPCRVENNPNWVVLFYSFDPTFFEKLPQSLLGPTVLRMTVRTVRELCAKIDMLCCHGNKTLQWKLFVFVPTLTFVMLATVWLIRHSYCGIRKIVVSNENTSR